MLWMCCLVSVGRDWRSSHFHPLVSSQKSCTLLALLSIPVRFWISLDKGCSFTHGSSQKWVFLLSRTCILVPLFTMESASTMPIQALEHTCFALIASMPFFPWAYFSFKTLTHKLSLSVIIFHPNFAIKAMFMSFAALIPNPPVFFGFWPLPNHVQKNI